MNKSSIYILIMFFGGFIMGIGGIFIFLDTHNENVYRLLVAVGVLILAIGGYCYRDNMSNLSSERYEELVRQTESTFENQKKLDEKITANIDERSRKERNRYKPIFLLSLCGRVNGKYDRIKICNLGERIIIRDIISENKSLHFSFFKNRPIEKEEYLEIIIEPMQSSLPLSYLFTINYENLLGENLFQKISVESNVNHNLHVDIS